MITEIIIYIALFAILFSGAFNAVFQTVDAVGVLKVKKNDIDNLYFLQSRLDALVWSTLDWNILTETYVKESISNEAVLIDSFSSQIFETAGGSNRVLFLTLGINQVLYKFSYVQGK